MAVIEAANPLPLNCQTANNKVVSVHDRFDKTFKMPRKYVGKWRLFSRYTTDDVNQYSAL